MRGWPANIRRLSRPDQDVDAFALSIRAVAEPIMGKLLEEVSFGKPRPNPRYVSAISSEMQPELFLLQKHVDGRGDQPPARPQFEYLDLS